MDTDSNETTDWVSSTAGLEAVTADRHLQPPVAGTTHPKSGVATQLPEHGIML